jgi:hypothetical protein
MFTKEPSMRNPAMRAGLIFGLMNAVIGAIGTGVVIAVASAAPARLTGEDNQTYGRLIVSYALIIGAVALVLIVINLVLYLLAGRSAAAKDGSAATGALAGIVTAVVAGLIGIVISVAINVVGVTTALQTSTSTTVRGSGALHVIGDIFLLALGAAFGAGLGALGGLIGRGAYQKAQAGAMPMGMPGGYPQQPMR